MKIKRILLFVISMTLIFLLVTFGLWFSAEPSLKEWSLPLVQSGSSEDIISDDDIPVPILMYHSIVKNPKKQNEFYLSVTILESDLEYLKEKGYTAIFMKDLIDCVKNKTPLPEKPVMLTFDDGCYNNYLYVTPLLEQHGMKGVLSILGMGTEECSKMGDDADHVEYSHVTWEEVRKMIYSGIWEIQNHTYDSHRYRFGRRGITRLPGESPEAYREYLKEDVGYLQDRITEMTGITPTTFTFPYGFHDEDSTEYLKELGFSASLSCIEGINYIPQEGQNEDILFNLKRIPRLAGLSMETLLKKYGLNP